MDSRWVGSTPGRSSASEALSKRVDRIERGHLLEVAVAETVDAAGVEVPPGDLEMPRELDVADLVGLPHLPVDLAHLVGGHRGEELVEGVEELPVVDRHRDHRRAPPLDAA